MFILKEDRTSLIQNMIDKYQDHPSDNVVVDSSAIDIQSPLVPLTKGSSKAVSRRS